MSPVSSHTTLAHLQLHYFKYLVTAAVTKCSLDITTHRCLKTNVKGYCYVVKDKCSHLLRIKVAVVVDYREVLGRVHGARAVEWAGKGLHHEVTSVNVEEGVDMAKERGCKAKKIHSSAAGIKYLAQLN